MLYACCFFLLFNQCYFVLPRCGVALDCWMLPLYREVKDSIGSSLSQPFYFINSFAFQWKNNVLKMMSLCQSPDASGRTPRRVLTLE